MSQKHCSSNNRVVILDSERNGLWEDLCLKPTKINNRQGSGAVRRGALPWEGAPWLWFQNRASVLSEKRLRQHRITATKTYRCFHKTVITGDTNPSDFKLPMTSCFLKLWLGSRDGNEKPTSMVFWALSLPDRTRSVHSGIRERGLLCEHFLAWQARNSGRGERRSQPPWWVIITKHKQRRVS